jgi:hypothetical protein
MSSACLRRFFRAKTQQSTVEIILSSPNIAILPFIFAPEIFGDQSHSMTEGIKQKGDPIYLLDDKTFWCQIFTWATCIAQALESFSDAACS